MEDQKLPSKRDRASDVILGLFLSVGLFYLYQFMFALDGMRAMSGKPLLFSWIHMAVPFIPMAIILFLVIVDFNSLMTRMGK